MTHFSGKLGTKTLGARLTRTAALSALLKQMQCGQRVVLLPGGGSGQGEDEGSPFVLYDPELHAEEVVEAVGGLEAARQLKKVQAEPFLACKLRDHQREGVR